MIYIYIHIKNECSSLCHSCGFNYQQRVNVSCSLAMEFTGKLVNFCIICNLNVPNIFMKVIHLKYVIRIKPEKLQISIFWPNISLFYKKLRHCEVLTKVNFQTLYFNTLGMFDLEQSEGRFDLQMSERKLLVNKPLLYFLENYKLTFSGIYMFNITNCVLC